MTSQTDDVISACERDKVTPKSEDFRIFVSESVVIKKDGAVL